MWFYRVRYNAWFLENTTKDLRTLVFRLAYTFNPDIFQDEEFIDFKLILGFRYQIGKNAGNHKRIFKLNPRRFFLGKREYWLWTRSSLDEKLPEEKYIDVELTEDNMITVEEIIEWLETSAKPSIQYAPELLEFLNNVVKVKNERKRLATVLH